MSNFNKSKGMYGPATIVVGCQWGDEGKGKIVDYLSSDFEAVVRYHGGHNAGHTIIKNNKKIVLRLIPSGILHDKVKVFIGNGVIVSPKFLLQEIEYLEKSEIPNVLDRLFISEDCHICLPYHVLLDKARENKLSKDAIGTTLCGIGPVYEDKVSRFGIRISDLFGDQAAFLSKLNERINYYNFIAEKYYGYTNDKCNVESIIQELDQFKNKLSKNIVKVGDCLNSLYEKNGKILFEGAQGTLLDIDYGTYPYVTSSNTTAAQASIGSGIGFNKITYVLGVSKAYATRVGNGPFLTEIHNDIGLKLRECGNEFGSVTARARRCGWLDLVSLKKALEINSATGICITKLDVLKNMPQINLCVDYDYDESCLSKDEVTKSSSIAVNKQSLSKVSACKYKTFNAWNDDITHIKSYEKLPIETRKYIDFIEEYCQIPVVMLSVGSDRQDVIFKNS